MSQFDAVERIIIGLAFKVILYVLCGSLAGCNVVGGALVPSRGVPRSLAFLAIVDKALEMYRPELQDDLEKGTGEAPTEAVKDDRPVVKVYVTGPCTYCKKLKADVKGYDKIRWEFIDQGPEWVTSWPTLHWKGSDGWRQMSGWTDLRTFLAEWQKSQKAKDQDANLRLDPNQAGKVGVLPQTSGHYPVHAQRWNINGNWHPSRAEAIRHLLSDGIHRGKFSRSYLESLSRAELLSLHDSDHERRVQWAYVNRPSQSAPRRRASRTYCPTCPT